MPSIAGVRQASSLAFAVLAALLLIAVAHAPAAAARTGVGQRHLVTPAPKTQHPAPGATVSGRINWTVKVRRRGLRRLIYVVDGRRRIRGGRRRSMTLNTTRMRNGRHTLTAVAVWPGGYRVRSRPVPIEVSNASRVQPPVEEPVNEPRNGPGTIYWGAQIGDHLTGTQAPWDMNAVNRFEEMAGKRQSLIHFAAPFANCAASPCYRYSFPTALMEQIRNRGAIPFFSWASQAIGLPDPRVQPNYQLADVIAGTHDAHIRAFAEEARAWGHPFFLRFNFEMNGGWFPWSERANGNQEGEYVAAWRHVHDIFQSVGATNATWVWCPHVDPANRWQDIRSLYPGDAYVDWTCLDGYNWGTKPGGGTFTAQNGWKTFDQLFSSTYRLITQQIAPSKPMVIGEIGSSEFGGSKAAWQRDALDRIPSYSKIRGLVWFEKYDDNMDWPIGTSASSVSAFAEGIGNPAYATNQFANAGPGAIAPTG